MYYCLICGYEKLEKPQYEKEIYPTFEICPCCGFEAGFEDLSEDICIVQYRNKWINDGMKWWNRKGKPLIGWYTEKQLMNIERATLSWKSKIK